MTRISEKIDFSIFVFILFFGEKIIFQATEAPKADPGWLFKKTAIWRCEIVMQSDTGSF